MRIKPQSISVEVRAWDMLYRFFASPILWKMCILYLQSTYYRDRQCRPLWSDPFTGEYWQLIKQKNQRVLFHTYFWRQVIILYRHLRCPVPLLPDLPCLRGWLSFCEITRLFYTKPNRVNDLQTHPSVWLAGCLSPVRRVPLLRPRIRDLLSVLHPVTFFMRSVGSG